MKDVRITTDPNRVGHASVEVNGASVGAAVGSYTLTQRVGEPPRLVFEVPLVTRVDFGGPAVVVMSDRCAEALVALGWTPPAAEDEQQCGRCRVLLGRTCVERGRADGGRPDCGACPDCVRVAAQHREAAAAEDGEQVTVRRIEVLRYRVVLPHGTLKGIAEADARQLARLYGGAVDRQVVRLDPDGGEHLGPWEPVALEVADV